MKKKGLIISTVVMVVVLIASLTTATYAWFNPNASARVDDLTIETKAAQGLQIAMANKALSLDGIVSGELAYDRTVAEGGNRWSGDVDGWGQYLGFGSIEIGEMDHAVTKVDSSTPITYLDGNYAVTTDTSATAGKTYYKETAFTGSAWEDGVDYYTKSDDGSKFEKVNKATVTEPVTDPATEYFTIASASVAGVEDFAAAKFLEPTTATYTADGFAKPISYTAAGLPMGGFEAAKANEDYYELTMAVTNTKDIKAIGMGIVVTSSTGDPKGMVSAARIELSVAKSDINATSGTATPGSAIPVIEPYKDVVRNSNGTWSHVEAADIDADDNQYQITLDKGSIVQGTVYYVTVRIWIEGTDNACVNLTAGTGFTVAIEFVFNESEATLVYDPSNGATAPTEVTYA